MMVHYLRANSRADHDVGLSRLSVIISGLIILATVLLAAPAEADFYYVAIHGSDSNPGTELQPFRTLNRGVKALKPGDTLFIKSGTYAESLDNAIPGGISWEFPVVVAAFPGDTVIIKPPPGASRVLHFRGANKKYITIDGLTLDAANVTSDAIKITHGSTEGSAHHIRIRNSEVMNAKTQGILVSSHAHGNEFINLNIHHNGSTDKDHGLYITSDNNLIEGCQIHDHPGYGVHIYTSGPTADYNVVRKNLVYNNREAGILITRGTGNIAYNNIVWGNKGWGGIRTDYGAIDSLLLNNTVYGNAGAGIYIGSRSMGTIAKNNIAYAHSNNIVDKGIHSILERNLTHDPRFVDAPEKNFLLHSDSPAIDKGLTLTQVTDDYAGVRRPQGAGYDIGAVEYQNSNLLIKQDLGLP
jgi:parallel beta-helix repeat protein